MNYTIMKCNEIEAKFDVRYVKLVKRVMVKTDGDNPLNMSLSIRESENLANQILFTLQDANVKA